MASGQGKGHLCFGLACSGCPHRRKAFFSPQSCPVSDDPHASSQARLEELIREKDGLLLKQEIEIKDLTSRSQALERDKTAQEAQYNLLKAEREAESARIRDELRAARADLDRERALRAESDKSHVEQMDVALRAERQKRDEIDRTKQAMIDRLRLELEQAHLRAEGLEVSCRDQLKRLRERLEQDKLRLEEDDNRRKEELRQVRQDLEQERDLRTEKDR